MLYPEILDVKKIQLFRYNFKWREILVTTDQ